MPANTDAHNIPLGLGIYPRSQKYKGLNGGRDTNNETFQSSPEPLQSESAGSDDAPTRGGTDYWRQSWGGGVHYRFQDFCDGEDLRDYNGSSSVTEDVGIQVAEVGESSAVD